MIKRITRAYVRTYTDTGQVTAYVEWVDGKDVPARIEGKQHSEHMREMLARAKREGVTIEKETW